MILKEVTLLLEQLHRENKTNSKEEREFNLSWIKAIRHSIKVSFEKQENIKLT